ncbi:MAG: hypothetical protein ACYTBX_15930 [Planctomycetota bacterium]
MPTTAKQFLYRIGRVCWAGVTFWATTWGRPYNPREHIGSPLRRIHLLAYLLVNLIDGYGIDVVLWVGAFYLKASAVAFLGVW